MAFFKQDSKTIAADVNKMWHNGMTQSMFDAMFSIAYNHGNISHTTLGKTIQGDGYKNKSKVTTTWQSSYVLPGSRYEKGLRRRRIREANLFYSEGYDGNAPTPPVDENSMDNYYDQLAGV
jgi:GH24 family phage-related lysozyme (muramidase)